MQRFLIVLLAMLWTHEYVWSQSVIINEMSQGSDGGKEWVELLIVDEGVDLRGWELGDFDDGVWHSIAEFSTHSEWSNIASGTIVVIYNSGDVDETIIATGGEDTTFSDKSVLIGVNNSSFLIDTGPWGGTSGAFANSDGDDAPAIRNASDQIIHDMAVTHPTATVSSPGSAKVKYYTGNTVGGVVDDINWVTASSSSGTPGEANGDDNSNWVDQSLPVELSRWFATSKNGEVRLNWTTDSEIENQGFIIDRCLIQTHGPNSELVEEWYEIVSFTTNPDLLGQGSTSTQHDYSYIDRQVIVGETYSYRLSDVDYRGNVTQHSEIIVSVMDTQESQGFTITTYPNPSNSGIHLVVGTENEIQLLRVDILNLKGEFVKNVFSGTPLTTMVELPWDGLDTDEIPVPSGIYIAKAAGPNISHSQIFTIIQ
ncbi:MAG: hypothetical protein ISR87_13955 [Candidatus Marinimicrobia bacterium]|nr:hypothetical protein [Candidatus Neomarinimicrobiota bacterium]